MKKKKNMDTVCFCYSFSLHIDDYRQGNITSPHILFVLPFKVLLWLLVLYGLEKHFTKISREHMMWSHMPTNWLLNSLVVMEPSRCK